MRWQRSLMGLLKDRKDKKIALAIDTSTNQVRSILINNIIKFFGEMIPETQLVQADFKIRSITPIQNPTIKYYTHGKSSYTEVLEWADQEKIDTLFYITDVTGYFYEELKVQTEVFWLVPDDYVPKVPFGKAIKVA
ncbi:VWA-like domain-containing protein [Bacillus sp. REN16]|uniref:VWA-like domain-containing protein n=1 Tax=Bacillus sp. REN16 TaxID=2887296 RepID=UPI001E532D87|nr:VWA-like domain-containing protein [Bacillus sp. REN16]MCC3357673.1 VWA-like domain-containing protein [Bacillus sp. REN16]